MAHLSAALGQKTWVFLKKIPDWRWGLYGEDSFWYESMKLYRQEKIEEWDTPLSKMKKDLKELLIRDGVKNFSEIIGNKTLS